MFFAPLFLPGVEIVVWGLPAPEPLPEPLARYLSPPLTPLHLHELPCRLPFRECQPGEWEIRPARIRAVPVLHPGPTLGYRIGLLLGKRVLVTGANGGVGRFAIQLARESGAHVTAHVRDAAASEELLGRLGAAEVVETISDDYDLIVDGVGGETLGRAIEQVAPRGVVVNIATQSDDEIVTFQAARFDRAKGARIYTLNLFDELADTGASSELDRLCGLVAKGRLDGQIELEGSWRDAGRALAALLERRIGGKAVLHVD